MNKIHKTITINAPAHTVFEYIREPINLRDLCSNLIAVEDIQQLPNGGRSFKWEYKMVNVHFFGTSSTTEYDVNQRLINSIQGGITGTTTWTFQSENEWTHVTLIIEYALPSLFVQKHGVSTIISENEAVVTACLESLKTLMEKTGKHLITVDEVQTSRG